MREFRNAALIAAGIASAGFGLKGFLLSSHFIGGGVAGVSMLLGPVTGVPLAIVLPTFPIVPFVVAMTVLGSSRPSW